MTTKVLSDPKLPEIDPDFESGKNLTEEDLEKANNFIINVDDSDLNSDWIKHVALHPEDVKKRDFTLDEAKEIGDSIDIDWNQINPKEFRMGLKIELEHGNKNPDTNVTDDDMEITAKIALAHLNEIPDYYTKLKTIEKASLDGEEEERILRVLDFFKNNPNPSDEEVHNLAEELGVEPSELEEVIYRLFSEDISKSFIDTYEKIANQQATEEEVNTLFGKLKKSIEENYQEIDSSVRQKLYKLFL